MKFPKHCSPYSNRLALFRRPTKVAQAVTLAAFVAAASLPIFSFTAQAANVEDDYISGTGALSAASNWSLLALPTVSNDAVFPVTTAAATNRSVTGVTLTVGSFNDLSLANAVVLQDTSGGATAGTIIFGGTGNQGNSVSGTAADLLFVTAGGTFDILGTNGSSPAGGTGVLGVSLGQSGNFNVAGTPNATGSAGAAVPNIFGASTITSIIDDGGKGYSITKTGAGTLTLGGANTFSGGLNLNAGTVSIAAVNNLGTGTVAFNGGTLAITTAAVDPSTQFSQAAGQAYNISSAVATTFATALTSAGGSFSKAGAGTLTSTAANTFAGATTIAGGSLALSGAAGSLASTTINLQSATTGGGLILINTGAGNNTVNRVADTANVILNGGSFVIGGSDQTTTNIAETVGTFTLGTGSASGTSNIITVTPGTGGSTTLTATNGVVRAAGSSMALINGAGLGSNATSASRFFVGTAPTLVGAGTPSAAGNPGTGAGAQLNTGIVTGLVGESSTTTGTGSGTASGVANTFLTYTAGGGFRPLNPTDEFTQNAFTTGNNTRITTASVLTASTAVNSLIVGAGITMNSGFKLTDTSGMVLFTTTAAVAPATSATNTGLAFGTAEGNVYVDSGVTATFTTPISGSNGLTFSGAGSTAINSGSGITLTGGNLVNTQHLLTLSATNSFSNGAGVISSAGNGAILFIASTTSLTGASSLTLTNNSQARFTSGAQTFTLPVNLGDATTTGNIQYNGSGSGSNFIFTGLYTLNSPQIAALQSFNTGNNAVAITGGITSAVTGGATPVTTGTGGVEFESGGSTATSDHRITLGGTLNYVGPTQFAATSLSNLRVTLSGTTTLPTNTVLGFRMPITGTDVQFDLNGINQTVAGLQTLLTAGTAATQIINSSATSATLTVNNTSNYAYSGSLGTVGTINAGGTAPNATGSTATIILAATTSNGFSLTKTGTGTLTLAGAGSYTGGTAINGGKILLTVGTALGTGGVTIGTGVNAGALATGPGALTMTNLITTNGTGSILSPGATTTAAAGAVGALTLSGGLNLGNGGTIPFDLASTTALSDVIKVTGGTFTGATGTGSNSITFAFNNLAATVGTTYTLINFAGSTTADTDLSDFAATGVAGNFVFNMNGANELDFTVTAVPESSTYIGGLLMMVALGCSMRGRLTRRPA